MPHLNIPSRTDIEHCVSALEIEDQREAEAIRLFYERERQERRARRLRLVLLMLCALAALAWWVK